VTVFNNSSSTAHSVVATEVLPAGTTFASATAYTYNSGTNTWSWSPITPGLSNNQAVYSLGDLPSHFVYYIYPTLLLDPSLPIGTQLTDTETVASTEVDSFPSDNTASVTVQVVAATVDLSATMNLITAPQYITPGSQVQYLLDYSNLGTTTAQGVVVTDTLPVGATYVSNAVFPPIPSSCPPSAPTPVSVNGNQVVYNLGSVPSGGSGCLNLAAQLDSGITPGTTITNVMQVSGTDTDTNPNNNMVTLASTVQTPVVDLSASIRSLGECSLQCNPYPVGQGSAADFSTNVANNGNAIAHNVTLTEALPSNSTFLGASLTSFNAGHPEYGTSYLGPITPTVSGNVATFVLPDLAPVSSPRNLVHSESEC
jgi:uncharacterized repeat protein (TIGR01451 family)